MIKERRGAYKRLDKNYAGYRNKESVYCLPRKNSSLNTHGIKEIERKRTKQNKKPHSNY
jgi:hypothetical protein